MTEKTHTSRLASFLINEIRPRVKKSGTSPENIYPAVYNHLLVIAERDGLLYRQQTRQYLDYVLADYLGDTRAPNDTVLYVVVAVRRIIKHMVDKYND